MTKQEIQERINKSREKYQARKAEERSKAKLWKEEIKKGFKWFKENDCYFYEFNEHVSMGLHITDNEATIAFCTRHKDDLSNWRVAKGVLGNKLQDPNKSFSWSTDFTNLYNYAEVVKVSMLCSTSLGLEDYKGILSYEEYKFLKTFRDLRFNLLI